MSMFKNLKLVCLDNDDVLFNSSPLIQYHLVKNFPQFPREILDTRERTISALNCQYNLVKKEIEKAQRKKKIPNLKNLNAIRNDVIRETSSPSGDFEYEYYIRPLIELGDCIELATRDKEMFLEERDATIEADGKKTHGIIPYDEIYQESNWFPYTKQNVIELYKVFGSRLISLTAHNGIDDMHGREFEAKGDAIHRMEPAIEHYGLRFHRTEHVPGVRRPRNSKAEKIMEIYGLDDLVGVVLIDDSIVNCQDILNHGGSAIWINRNKDMPNSDGFAMAKSIKPESIYRELERLGYGDGSNTIYQKPKTYRK